MKHKIGNQLSFQVTQEEIEIAEKALVIFKATKTLLTKANDYLNIIHTPFSKAPDIDVNQIWKFRAALRRFRDKSVKNFNEFKVASFKCVKIMNNFSSDTQTIKLMKSFTNSIEELESRVNDFVDVFSDLKDKDFVQNVVKGVESIQQKCEEINDLIDSRIKTHIKNNILSKNWVDSVGDELQMKVEKKVPPMIDIYQKGK